MRRIIFALVTAVSALAPGAVLAETLTLQCQIEVTVAGNNIGWQQSSNVLRIDLDARTMQVVRQTGEQGDSFACDEISDTRISCGAGLSFHYIINRYSGEYTIRNLPCDTRIWRNGACRRIAERQF